MIVSAPPTPPFVGIEHAICRGCDPRLFYTERGASTKEAKAVCAECPVIEPCLEYALVNNELFGIWGGLSRKERLRYRRSVAA